MKGEELVGVFAEKKVHWTLERIWIVDVFHAQTVHKPKVNARQRVERLQVENNRKKEEDLPQFQGFGIEQQPTKKDSSTGSQFSTGSALGHPRLVFVMFHPPAHTWCRYFKLLLPLQFQGWRTSNALHPPGLTARKKSSNKRLANHKMKVEYTFLVRR